MKEKRISVRESDLVLMILATFRYSLGRHTYMPSFAIQMIKDHINIIQHAKIDQIIEEIEQYEKEYTNEYDIDRQQWVLLKEQLMNIPKEV